MAAARQRTLERLEVRPIGKVASAGAEASAEAWVQARRASRACVRPGEVFSTEGSQEFCVSMCSPAVGGALSSTTEAKVNSSHVPVLLRLQLTCLDGGGQGLDNSDETENDRLYKEYVKPYLLKLREARRKEGGRILEMLCQDQVLVCSGREFGIRALDPAGRCGALDETTEVYVNHVETPALDKVHVLPYEDTLPAAYDFDLFRDFLQPFFQAHPFSAHGVGDHFTYGGVRFRVMATDPGSGSARVSNQTIVYTEGDPLRPTILDLMPQELRQDLQRLPRGLQMLLLNTMAHEEAVRGRLTEVHETLRRGQGLDATELGSCGRTLRWNASEHLGDTQQQCMVCLTEFTDGDNLRQLVCDHLFHQACIDEWLQRSPACPICKRSVGNGASSSSRASGAANDSRSSGASLLSNALVMCDGGVQGTIIGFESSQQKFRVRLDRTSSGRPEERLLSPDEVVQQLSGVQLVGLRTSAELNGATVHIIGLNATRDQYQVRLNAERILSVRPENCVLPEGAVARVVGLRTDGLGARWNGQYGRIVGYDRQRGRHLLAMQPRGQLLSVRPRNLRA